MKAAQVLCRRQGGVALITAVLVVALASTAAVAMVARQQVDIRHTGNLLEAEQALLYAQGAEDWAAQILKRDRKDNQGDHLGEDWAIVLPPLPVDGGQISGAIEDMQGRFNLNNLIENDDASALDVERFRNLLLALGLDPDLSNALVDWMDADDQARYPGGAEDTLYLNRERPYRAANRLLASPSELRLVEGFTPEAVALLLPHVAALPGRSTLNVNTASATVLRSLSDQLKAQDAEQLEANEDKNWKSLADFLAENALAGLNIKQDGLGVESEYFMVTATVMMGRTRLIGYSLLQRNAQGETVAVMRAQGAY